MSSKACFRCSLLLPPAALLMTLLFAAGNSELQILTVGALVIAGVPYMVFSLLFLLLSLRASLSRLKTLLWLSPVIFCGLNYLWLKLEVLIRTLGSGTEPSGKVEVLWLVSCFFTLAIGYALVAVIFLLYALGRKAGWLHAE